MNRSTLLPFILLAVISFAVQLPTACAGIVISGNVSPDDPANWNSFTLGFVGYSGYGTLTVDSDSDLYSYFVTIGSSSGSTGVVTVAGTGSTWTNGNTINVGQSGNGTLNIIGGGAVSSNPGLSSEYAACTIGSSMGMGVVMIDGAGSNWTNTGSLAVGYSRLCFKTALSSKWDFVQSIVGLTLPLSLCHGGQRNDSTSTYE